MYCALRKLCCMQSRLNVSAVTYGRQRLLCSPAFCTVPIPATGATAPFDPFTTMACRSCWSYLYSGQGQAIAGPSSVLQCPSAFAAAQPSFAHCQAATLLQATFCLSCRVFCESLAHVWKGFCCLEWCCTKHYPASVDDPSSIVPIYSNVSIMCTDHVLCPCHGISTMFTRVTKAQLLWCSIH